MPKSLLSSQQKVLLALLRQARVERGLQQQDVATRLGKPQSFVSKYESGERRLDLIELRQVCAAIGLSLPDFIGRFEDALNESP